MSSSCSSNFTPIPFSKLSSQEALNLKPANLCHLHAKRETYRNSSWSGSSGSTSSDSDDSIGSPKSPKSCDQMTSPFTKGHGSLAANVNRQKIVNNKNGFSSPTMRQKCVKSEADRCRSSHLNPPVKYTRQSSVQAVQTYQHASCVPRKISLPAKPAVQFSAEIQIYELKRH